MKPRQVLAGTTYMLTRKTTQGMFLLRPSATVRNCIRYCIALAQERSGVRIHSIVFLSNHYHIIVTDVLGKVPKFTEELNKLTARALNCNHSRWENFWSGGDQTSQVALAEPSDVLEKTVYLLANPTKAMLVAKGTDWPGVRLFRKGKYKATKPKFFFRSMANGGKLKDTVYIALTPPPIGEQPQLCDEVVERATKARALTPLTRSPDRGTFRKQPKRLPVDKQGMKPRQVLEGTTYMLTRKTTQGMFLLRPSATVRNCIRYCIGLAQKRSGVRIHSIVFLSNHYHIILTDVLGKVPKFTEELNKLVARALNCNYGRWENFWSGGDQTSQVALTEPSDVLEKTVYLLANPTKAMLVAKGTDWPGVRLFRKGKYKATKPKFFFRSMDDGGKLKDTAYITLTPPPIGEQPQLCDEVVERATKAREKQIRLKAKLAGKKFMGRSKVMAQDVYASPRRPAPRRGLSPQVACRDKWRRIEVLQRLAEFVTAHKEKREAFIAGALDVVFPAGTYKMVCQYGAKCEQL